MKKIDLAELKKRWQSRAVLAVTLESRRVAVSVARRDGEEPKVALSFELPLGADAVLADPEKAGRELAARLQAEGVRERRCVVCMPASWALATSTDVPEMSAEDLRGYLELKAEREFPVAVSDLRLAHCAFRLPDGNQRATLAAVPTKRMEAIERMLAVAGCRAVSISLGLDRCLEGDPPASAVHFLANCSRIDVVITAGGGIAALRSLSGSGVSEDGFDAAAFSREVRITLGRLPEAIRQQVNEARFTGVRDTAEALCLKTREHLRRMGVEPASIERGADPAGAAFEAASRLLRGQPVTFDFVVPQPNRWEALARRFEGRRNRSIAAAVAALVVLPIVGFIVRGQIESSLEDEWNGMSRSVAELEVLQQKVRQFRAWSDALPLTVGALEGLVSAFPEQGDVWAKNIQVGENGKVTCTGFARSQAALLGLLDRLRARPGVSEIKVQQMRGENPVEFSLIYKMEPQHE
jgi:hypothetical protein